MTSNKLPDINALSKIAEDIYNNIPNDVKEENNGNFIAIELDSKEYFFGAGKDEAVQKAKSKYADKLVFIRRVGNVERIQQLYKKNLSKYSARNTLTYAGLL
jgi:hypothetical protein